MGRRVLILNERDPTHPKAGGAEIHVSEIFRRLVARGFLGGCALECCLKVAICVTLKLDGLPAAFKTHDLEALLLYSGFRADLEAQRDIQKSLSAVVEQWRPDGREKLLYGQPSKFDEKTGVLPWLQSRTSKQQ